MWKYANTKERNDYLLSLDLLNCHDEKKYIKTLYSISNQIEKNYRVFKMKKKNGKTRTIYAPNPLLKHIQRRILDEVLSERPISPYAKAYYPGLTLKDNAEPHVGKDMILKLDIRNFFESISFTDVLHAAFPQELYPKQIGILFTYLCTYDEHLTQGSPTSAYISNLVLKDFDEEIGEWCKNIGINYTRYSDDMTFSGHFEVTPLITKVKNLLKKKGLRLNYDKVHVVTKSSRQSVTGVTVNEKIRASAQYRATIRQEMYYITKFGLSSHLKKRKIDDTPEHYLNVLYGKILFVLSLDRRDREFKNYKCTIEIIKKKGNVI